MLIFSSLERVLFRIGYLKDMHMAERKHYEKQKAIALILALFIASGLLFALPAAADEEALASLYKWRYMYPCKDGYEYRLGPDEHKVTEAEFEESVMLEPPGRWKFHETDFGWWYGDFNLLHLNLWACFKNESGIKPTDRLSCLLDSLILPDDKTFIKK